MIFSIETETTSLMLENSIDNTHKMIQRNNLYQFEKKDKIVMPRHVAKSIEKLFKQGSTCEELEKIYQIIRDENPNYLHPDNSNARKIIAARKVKGAVRKMPKTAYYLILDVLGISSGKAAPGRQLDLVTDQLNEQSNVTKNGE